MNTCPDQYGKAIIECPRIISKELKHRVESGIENTFAALLLTLLLVGLIRMAHLYRIIKG